MLDLYRVKAPYVFSAYTSLDKCGALWTWEYLRWKRVQPVPGGYLGVGRIFSLDVRVVLG